MKLYKGYLLLCSMIILLPRVVNAATLYRHVPFSVPMNFNDSLVVEYDFSEKKGIHCTSNAKHLLINFTYKGHDKSAYLPIHLESDHVPNQADEELADYKGVFSLSSPSPNKINAFSAYKVACQWE